MENDKIVKIHGYYGVNNLGDDYILYALLNQIRNNSNNIIVQIDSLSGYKGLNYILEEFPELTFQVIDLSAKRKLTERIKLMYKNDIYIFGGGGLFPADNVNEYLLLMIKMILYKVIGIKTAILGIDLCIINKKISKFIWKKIIRNTKYVCMRNKYSYNLLRDIFNSSNLLYASDLTFSFLTRFEIHDNLLKEYEVKKGIYNKNYIIWVVANPWNEFEMKEKHFQDRYNLLKKQIISLYEKYSGNEHLNIFIPFFGKRDMEFINDLINNVKIKPIICYEYENIAIKRALFKHANACISMRFHGIAFSLFHGIPVAAISYSPKISELMKENNLENYYCEYGIRTSETFFEEFDLDYDKFEIICEKVVNSEDKKIFEECSYRLKNLSKKYNNIIKDILN